jgi:hypothetical protein
MLAPRDRHAVVAVRNRNRLTVRSAFT